MSGDNGFSDREAGEVSQQIGSIKQTVEELNGNFEKFMKKEYDETKTMVERHRTWLQIIWGLISAIGSGVLGIFFWVLRGKFG